MAVAWKLRARKAHVMSRSGGSGAIVEKRSGWNSVGGGSLFRPSASRNSVWSRLAFGAACVIAIAVGLVMLQRATPGTYARGVDPITRSLAAASLAATAGYLVLLAVLHALPTGYSPVRHAVSDYGVGRYRGLFTVALGVSSIAVLTLAFALIRGFGTPPLPTRDLGYLLLIPLARIAMTLFPTDLEGRRVSRTGLLHYGFAIAAFTLTYLAISGLTPALRATDLSAWTRGPLGWTEWTVGPALALLVATMLRPLRRIFGLFERIFLLTSNLWFALAALLLLSRPS
ncbi:MAG: hypothetical protein JWM76_191 [Pseudonocardiales bacterium]|nr:hypothetical protein [Pseudonocardiales bacterium]